MTWFFAALEIFICTRCFVARKLQFFFNLFYSRKYHVSSFLKSFPLFCTIIFPYWYTESKFTAWSKEIVNTFDKCLDFGRTLSLVYAFETLIECGHADHLKQNGNSNRRSLAISYCLSKFDRLHSKAASCRVFSNASITTVLFPFLNFEFISSMTVFITVLYWGRKRLTVEGRATIGLLTVRNFRHCSSWLLNSKVKRFQTLWMTVFKNTCVWARSALRISCGK